MKSQLETVFVTRLRPEKVRGGLLILLCWEGRKIATHFMHVWYIYIPTFTIKTNYISVGKCTIHGSYRLWVALFENDMLMCFFTGLVPNKSDPWMIDSRWLVKWRIVTWYPPLTARSIHQNNEWWLIRWDINCWYLLASTLQTLLETWTILCGLVKMYYPPEGYSVVFC